jgi:hypothetical protein
MVIIRWLAARPTGDELSGPATGHDFESWTIFYLIFVNRLANCTIALIQFFQVILTAAGQKEPMAGLNAIIHMGQPLISRYPDDVYASAVVLSASSIPTETQKPGILCCDIETCTLEQS